MDIAELTRDGQPEKGVQTVLGKMKHLLTLDEVVLYVASQFFAKADAVILTNKRAIFYRPKLFSMSFDDFQWREVKDMHLTEKWTSATISCLSIDGNESKVEFLPKEQARRVYAFAQEMEERAHRTRQDTELEKLRAGAGGVVVHVPSVEKEGLVADKDPLTALTNLKRMLEAELISQNDYDEKKAELLKRL